MTTDILQRLAASFSAAGRQLYLVGGSVRDELLGRPHQDIDLATDARPDETKHLVAEAGADAVFAVGERFGTIGALFGERKVEITTFRSETYTPRSRKPAVEFGSSLVGDLGRRDFTINAIARDLATGALIDPFGGRRDLAGRRIRAVGRPEERFDEDPLRMLRAVRLSAELGFAIEAATRAAVVAQAQRLRDISQERIGDELSRLLVAPHPAHGLRLLADLGLMREVLPEVLATRDMPEGGRRFKNVFDHTLQVVEKVPPDLDLRWAALLHDVGKPETIGWDDGQVHFRGHEVVGAAMAERLLTRLRFDRQRVERVARLVAMHLRPNSYEPEWTDGAVRRVIREAGDELDLLLALSRADVTSQRRGRVAAAEARVEALAQRCRELIERENVKALKSPLDGNDLMALFGRGPGPWIKPVKEHLLNLVIEGTLAQDERERAVELARAFVATQAAPATRTA
ncbi:MAG: HD domain-containing protein [Chloroflexi bacterium]|nr:HD domain-containing protein [Chloroflexota bacterium]